MTLHELCAAAVNLLWRASWQSAVLIGSILLVRRLLGERLSPAWRCTLWMLVAVRLVVPMLPAAPWSLFNLISPAVADSSPVVAEVTIHIAPASNTPADVIQAPRHSDRAEYLALLWLAGALAMAGGTAWTNLKFSRRVRRRDLPMGWLMTGLRMIHWFNPLAWIALACWRADAEAACDRAVLDAVDARGRIDYGLTLLKLATSPHLPAPRSALGIIDGERQLRRRIGAIVRTDRPWRFGAAALIAILAFFGLTDARNRARAAAAPSTRPAAAILVSAKFLTLNSDLLAGPDIPDVEKLIQLAGPDGLISSPRINTIEGQKAVIFVGTILPYVSDLTPVRAADGTVTYKASTSTVQDGLEWSVIPKVMADGKIGLEMEVKFTKLQGFKEIPWRQNPALKVQAPELDIHSSASRIVVPNGTQTVITGLNEDKKTNVIIVTATIDRQ